MMDTTNLFLTQEQAGSKLIDCLPFLTNLSETYKQHTGKTYITGYAGNLRVSIFEYGASISGSLPKFYSGTNLHTLNRGDCKRAFEMMADTLHLPIHKANVTRVDIGHNLITQHKPELYYTYLGQSSYYNRLTQPKSISYQNSLRSKKFYNKIAESKSKGVAIPEIYQGKNLLRYELCYTQRLCKQFNQALITPHTLTEESFYMGLCDRWYNEYDIIQKIAFNNMDKKRMGTPKAFTEQLAALGAHFAGQDYLLSIAEEIKLNNGFSTPKSYERTVKKIKSLAKSSTTADIPELIQELNKKIARAKQSYR